MTGRQEGHDAPGGGRPRLYRCAAAEALLVRPLDGLTLIYHRPSGITHIVTSPVPEIVAALDAVPRDAAAVLGRLAAAFDIETDEAGDALHDLTAQLDHLCALGLALDGPGSAGG